MIRVRIKVCVSSAVAILPSLAHAQGLAGEIGGLQQVLDQLYQEMLPLCPTRREIRSCINSALSSTIACYALQPHLVAESLTTSCCMEKL